MRMHRLFVVFAILFALILQSGCTNDTPVDNTPSTRDARFHGIWILHRVNGELVPDTIFFRFFPSGITIQFDTSLVIIPGDHTEDSFSATYVHNEDSVDHLSVVSSLSSAFVNNLVYLYSGDDTLELKKLPGHQGSASLLDWTADYTVESSSDPQLKFTEPMKEGYLTFTYHSNLECSVQLTEHEEDSNVTVHGHAASFDPPYTSWNWYRVTPVTVEKNGDVYILTFPDPKGILGPVALGTQPLILTVRPVAK